MSRNARDERVVSQFDNRENSRIAMRRLLRFAQTKIESGIDGGLPLDEVATAKEYFTMWKRKKPFENNGFVFGVVSLLILLFYYNSQIDFEISLVVIGILYVLFVFLEMDKSKINYIKEMIGDISNISLKDRAFYLEGLRLELWNMEKEEVNIKFFVVLFLLQGISLVSMDLSSFLHFFDIDLIVNSQGLKSFGFLVGVISIIIFFNSDVILTKYRRK